MLKQAWRSYVASLHPRYLRKAYDNGTIFWLLYWAIIYPALMNMATDSVEIYDGMALVMMRLIPFFIMEWSNLNSKYLMTKMMYLSPMKEADRREYINNVLFIKIGVTVLLSICIEIVWSMFTEFNLLRVLIIAIMNLSLGVASYISLEALGKMNHKIYSIVKDKTDNTKNHWANNLVTISAIIVIALIAILELGAEESLAFVCRCLIVAITIGLIVLNILIIRNEYKATIALAGDYELAFKILGKVETPEVKFDLFQKKG